ncbi:hypothetical protein [Rhodovulum strictum]|uniref:Uncharacterized protein n=1 Tax=Rhodovulum strictum TaxID=58314 RepID=A0A844B6R6_9RHOB|nr:hypothetical protein [Rhodovulum strictum]MRH21911.1 hypothetical protein [Rhodovulum strictum]
MPFIAKTAPIPSLADEHIRIEERPMYGGRDIRVGSEVFLWSSETQGGVGLWGKGTVTAIDPGGPKPAITVRIDQRVNSGNFGLIEIAPHRDSTQDTPIVGLARKLYKHAHNKIAGLTNAEAELLQQNFE